MSNAVAVPRIDLRLTPAELVATMRADVRRGLTAAPKQLPPKYFYDARGSALFEDITRLPEYYPTRTERSILDTNAEEIAALSGADTLVELGSGSSDKTRLLLDALASAGHLRRYVPVDVSAVALLGAMEALSTGYPGLELHGVVADFERHLDELPSGGRRMVAFLGSTIGNLEPAERHEFLSEVRSGLAAGDTLQFNLNVLHVLNRELRADFDVDCYAHVARWNADEERIEMWLRARAPQRVTIAELDLVVPFDAGEELRTETSAKFRPNGIRAELEAIGLDVIGSWTDPDGDFALTLARAGD